MGFVLNKTTKELIESVNTPDYPTSDWVIDPDLSTVDGVPRKYWKVDYYDSLVVMSEQEQIDVDNALLPGFKINQINKLVADTRIYINNAYAPERQQTLSVLLADARNFTYSIDPITFSGTGLRDLSAGGSFNGSYNIPKFEIKITSVGSIDLFSVRDIVYDEILMENVAITGLDQDIAQGIKIKFTNITGHTLNDKFYVKIKRSIKKNRANYLLQALGWVLACLNYHYTKYAQIAGATTLQQCEAITWDFSVMNSTNPQVAIQIALAIQD